MATSFVNNSQVLFKCGALEDIADATTRLPYSSATGANPQGPALQPGKISIAIVNDALEQSRAFLYFDAVDKRYAVSGPVWWNDVQSKPTIANNITYTASTKKLALFDTAGGEITNVTLPFVKTSGDNISGHLYLTGAQENSSTSSTSQIVFGTSSNNHLALSSNKKALVINPTTSSTTNQIVLYLDQASLFPNGITSSSGTITAKSFVGPLTGTATNATKDSSNNTFVSSYMSYSSTDITQAHKIVFSTPNGTTKTWTENDHYPTALTWTAGTTAGPTATITMYKNGAADTASNISIAAIPSASATTSGVITTGNQTMRGIKTFDTSVVVGTVGTTNTTTKLSVYGSVNIGNDRVNLSYNEDAESLDFTFL